jgi:adenosylcobinamide-phosphate synthase
MFAALALLAAAIEAAVGYPDAVYRAIGHPVSWIGRLIAWCDKAWNSSARTVHGRRLHGIALLLLLLALGIGSGAMATLAVVDLFPELLALPFCALLASTLVAQRSLHAHVAAVADALEKGGLAAGRIAVSKIVGRDTADLDRHAVGRAAVESLAENFSDGVVAPLFWMVVAGLPGAIAYKAINTADSMIGHKTERYLAFGWAAARFDDLVNLPASRLSALWLVLAASLQKGMSPVHAMKVVSRDAGHHRSPNAGWPEAAMAGALGVQLAGPRTYHGVEVKDRWMGDGRTAVTVEDIRGALLLYRKACAVQIAVLVLLVAVIWFA